jgi:DNA-binding NarL/FixJ family response regulator
MVTRNDDARSVLIVEDDRRVLAALRALLAASPGFDDVTGTGSAATALEVARAQPPSVALVDLHLPDPRDGLGLLTALAGKLRIPTVAMSIESGLRAKALAAGAYCFVDKAGATDHLLAALRAAVATGAGRC